MDGCSQAEAKPQERKLAVEALEENLLDELRINPHSSAGTSWPESSIEPGAHPDVIRALPHLV
jgi:hypothetical protein